MVDGCNDRTDEQKIKDSFNALESVIRKTFIYFLNTDMKYLKMNMKIQKLEIKMRKTCIKYIKKYFKVKGINV